MSVENGLASKAYWLRTYQDRMARFAQAGQRNHMVTKGGLTFAARAAGLTPEQVIADAHAYGVTDRDACIKSGFASLERNGKGVTDGGAAGVRYTPRTAKAPPPPPQHAHHVRDLLSGMDAERGEIDWVREMSPNLDWMGKPPRVQTELFLRAAFRPDERLFVFRDAPPTPGVPGISMRRAADWLNGLGTLTGDHVVPNPFTGKQGETTDGKPSFIAQSCLAAFPFLIVEFDAMPLPTQCAFWRSFLLTSRLAPSLMAVVFSGNKSLHGLVHVGCHTLPDWQSVRDRFASLFASDPDPAYCADKQAMRPRTGTRLPGVKRCDSDASQELLYLNPAARTDTMWNGGGG